MCMYLLHEIVYRSLSVSCPLLFLLCEGSRSRDLTKLELLHSQDLQVRQIKLENGEGRRIRGYHN